MEQIIEYNLEYIIRLLISGMCGLIIGYERSSRNKGAGIRTHFVVCISAALMMIVSKYGFSDTNNYDSSRVAAQIVSGVGFLGAGMIFVREKMLVSGLTTAAGIWGTAGVGMSIGSGLYTIGVIATVFLVIAQLILHFDLFSSNDKSILHLDLVILNEENFNIIDFLESKNIKINTINIKKDMEKVYIELTFIYIVNNFDKNRFIESLLKDNKILKYKIY